MNMRARPPWLKAVFVCAEDDLPARLAEVDADPAALCEEAIPCNCRWWLVLVEHA